MSVNQDMVLEALKDGRKTVPQLIKITSLHLESIRRALINLDKWKLIDSVPISGDRSRKFYFLRRVEHGKIKS